jgi:hypothetical protein
LTADRVRGRHPFLSHCRLAYRFSGPQEHRRAEKGHPRGDPDLFPGALDRPGPRSPGMAQHSSWTSLRSHLGRFKAIPRGRKPKPVCTATSVIPDDTP